MTITNPIYAVAIIIAASLAMSVFSRMTENKIVSQKFSEIDGLRGYLALFVFIHHSVIWFSYARTSSWVAPDSNFYVQLGQGSVSLFFMITSFLFVDKLLSRKNSSFDWKGFFVGRIFRLFPLYLVAMVALFVIVSILSHGAMVDNVKDIIKSLIKWLTFTIVSAPDINGTHTSLIMAGVTWSLPYEWAFYMLLPLVWVMIGGRGTKAFLLISMLSIAWFIYHGMDAQIALNFFGGVAAAILIRKEKFRRFAGSRNGSIVATALILSIFFFPSAYGLKPFLVLTSAFCLIASGASLFGVLNAKVSHALGELAYSIYLLHGIVLFVLINFVVAKGRVGEMSVITYSGLVVLAVPFLLALSMVTFKYIELPGIALGKRISRQKPPAILSATA